MKKMGFKLVAILFYVGILLYGMGFQLKIIWSLKEVMMVIISGTILTMPHYKLGKNIVSVLGWNFLMAGYLTTFLLLFGRLNGGEADIISLQSIALDCRPILYGLVFYIILHTQERKTLEKSDIDLTKTDEQILEEMDETFTDYGLTAREREVAKYIYSGLSNGEIAEELCISETTVKKHVSHIFEKLNIVKREQIKSMINGKV